jgi:hypothetical protein
MKKILVLISNYGVNQAKYCEKLINELVYINKYQFNIVVFSSVPNNFNNCKEIIVKNYHDEDFTLCAYDFLKENQAYIQAQYDYILLTENDMLFNQANFDVFLKHELTLQDENHTIGFIRYENKNNEKYLIDLHYMYSVNIKTGKGIIETLNGNMINVENPHQGCFMLKPEQVYNILPKIYIGKPLEDKVSKVYYSNNNIGSPNGIKKFLPLEDLDSILIHHQPDKYVNVFSEITNLNDLKVK